MLSMDFFNPVDVRSGRGCFENFDGLSAFGKRCLLVTGKSSAKASGALDHAVALLNKADIPFQLFDKIEPNPLLSTCFDGGKAAFDFQADFIIGIGGGSPLDAAKAVAVFAANPQMPEADIFTAPRRDALPLLAIPTTAGTGSEVTPYAVLTVPEIENKRSFAGRDIYPKIAFLDPDYTNSLPLSATFATTADALSHAVEGFFMQKASAVSDALAKAAMPLLADGLRAVAAAETAAEISPATREALLYGSALAGMVISRTGTGFVHSTGYMLTYHHDVPHGQANAYFLADFVEFMAKAAPKRAKTVFSLCDVANGDGLFALLSASAAMPLTLQLPLERLAFYASFTIGARNVANGLAVLSEAELLAILQKRLGENS